MVQKGVKRTRAEPSTAGGAHTLRSPRTFAAMRDRRPRCKLVCRFLPNQPRTNTHEHRCTQRYRGRGRPKCPLAPPKAGTRTLILGRRTGSISRPGIMLDQRDHQIRLKRAQARPPSTRHQSPPSFRRQNRRKPTLQLELDRRCKSLPRRRPRRIVVLGLNLGAPR